MAARGLDVKELNLVINYECPNHMEDYVHRVGRTGRAGHKGTAITFITPAQDKYAGDLVKALKNSNAPVPEELKKLSEGKCPTLFYVSCIMYHVSCVMYHASMDRWIDGSRNMMDVCLIYCFRMGY